MLEGSLTGLNHCNQKPLHLDTSVYESFQLTRRSLQGFRVLKYTVNRFSAFVLQILNRASDS